jgi:hypothetical protein
MKNKNYGLTFGSSALFIGGLIFKFLWFILLFILVWGLAKFISEYFQFLKKPAEFLKLDKLDEKFTSILDWSYKHFPDLLYYAFLLRVPIISGLILFLFTLISFPLIPQFNASNFLQNIFVMESGIQLILVMSCATLTSITVVSLLKTTLVLIDENFNDKEYFRFGRFIGMIALFLPTWVLLLLNKETNIEWIYSFFGIAISAILLVITEIYEYRSNPIIKGIGSKISDISQPVISEISNSPIGSKISDISRPVIKGITTLKTRRIIFFTIQVISGLFFYGLVIFFNWPRNPSESILPNNLQAPTLLYVLLMIWILTLFVGLVTFLFDKSIDNQLDSQKKSLGKKVIFLVKKATKIGDNEEEEMKFTVEFLNKFQEKFKLLNHTFYWPVILFLIIFSGLGYGTFGVDHFFKLENSNTPVKMENYKQDFQEAIWNRLCEEKFDIKKEIQTCNKDKEQSLVVVAASGGGIQASGWMTQVLAGLQEQKSGIGEDFTKAIGLISSTSGGSVGSMFYLDQFENGILSDQGLKKDENKLSKVVKNSTDDWLNSVGWGLAFPDLFRAIGLPVVLNWFGENHKYLDRGYALEKNWGKTLTVGDKKPPTLDDRRKKILAGEVPIAVYNTTLVENGRPFLVSSMKFVEGTMANYASELSGKSVDDTALDFKTLYNNCGTNGDQPCDLTLTTAARLSASFPYVTPMARNDRENIIKNKEGQNIKVKDKNGNDTDFLQNYHITDGGYYDNSGAFTAMNWLNNFLEYNNSLKNKDHRINIKKVIILQINAFPEDKLELDQHGSPGFVVTTIGPVNTLNGIRDSTQIGRNKLFAELLKDRWHNDKNEENNISIQDFTISFPESKPLKDKDGNVVKDKDGNLVKIPYNPPLSWRLTESQKMNLVEAWQQDTDIRETVEKMKTFWTPEAKAKI